MNPSLPNFRTIYDAIISARSDGEFSLYVLKNRLNTQTLHDLPHLQGFLNEVRAEAEKVHAELPPQLTFQLFKQYETTGERAPYEQVYFSRRRAIIALTIAIIIDRRDEYRATLHDLLWTVCDEYTWALPAHLPVGVDAVKAYRLPPEQVIDLFASETAQMLAEIVYLLGDQLDDWLDYRIRSEIERRIFGPLFNHPHTFKWERDTHNWAAVCGGSIGMTALLLETDRERLAGMIDRLMRAMDSFLAGFGTDGGCPEGISYWVYGFGYYVYFAEMLDRFTNGTIDLLASAHIYKIASFPQTISLGNSQYINYSDATPFSIIPSGLASYLAAKLDVQIPNIQPPSFHSDFIYRWAHISRDLVWTTADILDQPVQDGTYYLDQLAWVVDRRTIHQIPLVFSAKGGHNDEPHNHNDLGHFIVHVGGENLLIDLGAGVYTRQYFSNQRYDIIHTSAYGHSVPVINGIPQQAGVDYRADVLAYQTYPKSVTYVLDLTKAYPVDALQSFIRAFDWSIDATNQSATLVINDQYQFSEPSQIEACFMSEIEPIVQTNQVEWAGKHGNLSLPFAPNQFEAVIETIETQDHHLMPITVYRLRLIAREKATLRTDQFVFTLEVF